MMKRMSFSETIFLFVLALVVFGPKKLPEIARQVGRMLNEFRRASNEFKSQIEQEIAHLEVEKQTILPPSPAPEGTASRELVTLPNEPGEPETRALATPLAEPAAASDSTAADETAPPAEPQAATEAVTSSSSQESHA
jgi:sec-independent protein translocase protein TatB